MYLEKFHKLNTNSESSNNNNNNNNTNTKPIASTNKNSSNPTNPKNTIELRKKLLTEAESILNQAKNYPAPYDFDRVLGLRISRDLQKIKDRKKSIK